MDDAATPGPAEQNSTADSTPAPAPAPAKRRLTTALRTPMSWPRRRRVGALLAVVALATTSGVAIAATSEPTPGISLSGSPSDEKAADEKAVVEKKMMLEKGMIAKRMHPGMGMGMGMGRGGVLHGEFTTPNGAEGYVTQMIQTGTVDSVSGDKLTVKSADGYTHDYAMTTDTVVNGARNWTSESRGGVASGQTVTVMATVKDGTATAVQVRGGDAKMAGEEGNLKMERFRGGMGADEKMKMRRFEMAPGQGMPGRMPAEPMPGGTVERFEMRGDTAVPAPAAPSEVPQDESADPTPSA